MDKNELLLSVTHGQIRRLKETIPINGMVNVIECNFSFNTPDWDDINIIANFFKGQELTEDTNVISVDVIDNKCFVPYEVLDKGDWFSLGVFGYRDNYRMVSEIISFKIDLGCYLEGISPMPPQPDIYDKIIKAIEQNTTDIKTNTDKIAINTNKISDNTANIKLNKEAIEKNIADIKVNTDNIAANQANISTNTTKIEENATNISNNTTKIEENTSNIATNTESIAVNTTKITETQTKLNGLIDDRTPATDHVYSSTRVEEILKHPQYNHMRVTVTQSPLGGFSASHNSSEIRNHVNGGGTVDLRFDDTIENSGEQVYTYLKFKDNIAYFRRPVVDTVTKTIRQIDIMVSYNGVVTFDDDKLSIADVIRGVKLDNGITIKPNSNGEISIKSGNNINITNSTNDIFEIAYKRTEALEIVPPTLENNNEYILPNTITDLMLRFPSGNNIIGDVIYVNFNSGETPTNLTIDTTNTSDIELTPEPNSGYEIFAKWNGSLWMLGYSEYSSMEVI